MPAIKNEFGDGLYSEWHILSDNAINYERIFNTSDEDIIWTDSIHDLIAELERRHPGPEEDLKHVVSPLLNYALVLRDLAYTGTISSKDDAELVRILEIAKKYGKIRIVLSPGCDLMAITNNLLDIGYYFRCVASRIDCRLGYREAYVIYDPLKAKKLKRKIKPSITSRDVLKLLHTLSNDLFQVVNTTINGVGLATDNMCAELKIVLSYHQLRFGKRSYLSIPEFQSIAKRWDDRSYKRFAAMGENGKEFAEWMNKQSKRKTSRDFSAQSDTRLYLAYPK